MLLWRVCDKNWTHTEEIGTIFLRNARKGLNLLIHDQLDTQFSFLICLFQFSTCFEQPRAHHQENQLYQYIWYMSLCVGDRLVCRSGRNRCCIGYNWFSWWWARYCWKYVENWNKHIRKNNCVSSWSFTRILPRCRVNRTQKQARKGLLRDVATNLKRI
jgi:hypothetical protein